MGNDEPPEEAPSSHPLHRRGRRFSASARQPLGAAEALNPCLPQAPRFAPGPVSCQPARHRCRPRTKTPRPPSFGGVAAASVLGAPVDCCQRNNKTPSSRPDKPPPPAIAREERHAKSHEERHEERH